MEVSSTLSTGSEGSVQHTLYREWGKCSAHSLQGVRDACCTQAQHAFTPLRCALSISEYPGESPTSGNDMMPSIEACAFRQGMCSQSRHVPSVKACDLSRGMCPQSRHVLSVEACALSRGMCPQARHVLSVEAGDLSRGMWPQSRHVPSVEACALSRGMHCTVYSTGKTTLVLH